MKFNNTDFATDYSGSAGSSTYSRGRGGAYRKLKPKPSNPNSDFQQAVRAQFSANSSAWRSLTDEERATWISQAPNYPYVDATGTSRIPSGFQLFCSCNGNLTAVQAANITTIGSPETIVTDSGINFTASDGDNEIVIGSSDTSVQGDHLQVFMTPPSSPSIGNLQSKLRSVASADAGNTYTGFSTSLTGAYISRYGALTGMAGKKIAFECWNTNAQGQTTRVAAGSIIIAA